MRIVKHGHACLELIDAGQRLIVDPGVYTAEMTGFENVQAVVLTHMHDDHCFEPQLDRLLANNPDLQIFGTDDVCARLAAVEGGDRFKTTAVHHGDHFPVGPFTLEFFGDLHQEIHRSMPMIQNVGVMVNDKLYYPGDSYTRPDRPVEILACPTSAPWLKIGDVIDFIEDVKPKRSFATHNIHLSDLGHQMNNGRVQMFTEKHGGAFQFLQVGDSTEA